ncbi:MAG TPA: ABC transporter ATP-binding protein [Burkholderiales bacterium]|jgi:NitT/TauT family transport system ATP-binding protein
MPEVVFEARDLGLTLPAADGPREILAHVDFTLAAGEILTIVGASGTGKTSLLRILAGLAAPSRGALTYRGKPVDGPQDGVAIVFQDYGNALLQWRSVARNVALGIERQFKGEALRSRVTEALQLVGLERNANDYPWQLSGGMQQRVQIARAIAMRPAVLLMDEPFGALDAMTKATQQDELLRLREATGASVIFITHDIEEAIYLGDRVALLSGSPGAITHRFEVGLPFPREQVTTREMPRFVDLRHELHEAIRATGGH